MRFFNTKKWHSDNGPVSPPATFPRDQRHLPSTPQRISEVTATWAELNPLFTASRLNKSRYWENWIKSGINSQTLKQITWALLAVRNSPPKAVIPVQFVNTVYMSMLSHSCLLDVSTPRRESPEKIDFEVLSSRLNPGVSDHRTRGS